jgi:hypothetical protein
VGVFLEQLLLVAASLKPIAAGKARAYTGSLPLLSPKAQFWMTVSISFFFLLLLAPSIYKFVLWLASKPAPEIQNRRKSKKKRREFRPATRVDDIIIPVRRDKHEAAPEQSVETNFDDEVTAPRHLRTQLEPFRNEDSAKSLSDSLALNRTRSRIKHEKD